MPKRYQTKISKSVALKKLSELLERVTKWNREYARYYRIDEIVLVGSLARNESSLGDIDLCIRCSEVGRFSRLDNKDEYVKWREKEFGLKPPRDFGGILNMYELDSLRYIKARDGRIELFRWDQLEFISLTMNPLVTLVKEGQVLFDSVIDAIFHAKPITFEQAENIVRRGEVRQFSEIDDAYWESYCQSLNKFPAKITELILDRDKTRERYLSSEHYPSCQVANRPD